MLDLEDVVKGVDVVNGVDVVDAVGVTEAVTNNSAKGQANQWKSIKSTT